MDKFKITNHGGFHLTIGQYTISVQWKPGSHCRHYDYSDPDDPQRRCFWESPDAEIGIWNREETWLTEEVVKKSLKRDINTKVLGWVTPMEVGKIIAWIVKQVEKENKLNKDTEDETEKSQDREGFLFGLPRI